MNIRQAHAEDLPQIITIEETCFPKAEAAGADEFEKRFKAFPENFFVAADGDKVVGFINGCTTDEPSLPDELYADTSLHKPDGAYQTVFGLDVLPDYQKQGIAAELMRNYIDVMKQRGKTGIVLTCKDRLIHYYEKLGYENQGRSASNHGGAEWNDMLLLF